MGTPPRGTLEIGRIAGSEVFPGTVRDVGVWIPPEVRDGGRPARVTIFQDGVTRGWWSLKGPWVLDRLLEAGRIPPMVGVFASSGVVPADRPDALPRWNRSFEYDEVGDRYARFVLDELLPWVSSEHDLALSDDPSDRALVGISSGGSAAFTAAWERPDAFRRVCSGIGSFVGLRGAHEHATLVRKVEPRPLRVFLQDGSADLDNPYGDWWMANLALERSLRFAGYDVRTAWGDGGHAGDQLGEVLPEALEWLWREPDAPVEVGLGWAEGCTVGRLVGGRPSWRDVGPAEGPPPADGATVRSPDHAWRFTVDPGAAVVHVHRIGADGSLEHGQPYLRLHATSAAAGRATALTVDRDGWVLAATELGIQVCDPVGRVAAILDPPERGVEVTALAFAGDGLDELEAVSGGRRHRRPIGTVGLAPDAAPITPPEPQL